MTDFLREIRVQKFRTREIGFLRTENDERWAASAVAARNVRGIRLLVPPNESPIS